MSRRKVIPTGLPNCLVTLGYKNIGYTTESPAAEYAKAIRRAKTREELIKALEPYKKIAADALKVAKKMSDQDFKDLKRDLPKAKREMPVEWIDEFNKRFGTIVMPEKLLFSSLTEKRYQVWGQPCLLCVQMNRCRDP